MNVLTKTFILLGIILMLNACQGENLSEQIEIHPLAGTWQGSRQQDFYDFDEQIAHTTNITFNVTIDSDFSGQADGILASGNPFEWKIADDNIDQYFLMMMESINQHKELSVYCKHYKIIEQSENFMELYKKSPTTAINIPVPEYQYVIETIILQK